MLARAHSGALIGVDAVLVEVEVDMSIGLPYFNVVGLPEGAVKESKVRVISALRNAGFDLPQKRITVNLAPADIRKEGAAFELAIALGALEAGGVLDRDALRQWVMGGELSLDGSPPVIAASKESSFRPPTQQRRPWSIASTSTRSTTSPRPSLT